MAKHISKLTEEQRKRFNKEAEPILEQFFHKEITSKIFWIKLDQIYTRILNEKNF